MSLVRVRMDRRHVGQSTEDFTPHFSIMKAWFETGDDRPWLLYCHIAMPRWRMMGKYRTQQEAMDATDLMVIPK